MGIIFGSSVFTSDKKRELMVTEIEKEFAKLNEEYLFALEFFEEYRTVTGFEDMMKELKAEQITALSVFQGKVELDIQMLRQKIDKINKNSRWMNSQTSIDNMEGLNRTVGRLLAIIEEVKHTKSMIDGEKTENKKLEESQQIGPQQ